jgi:ABC-type glycerol-3-phosphate transport system substrate-binding protein
MKYVFLAAFVVLTALSALTWLWRPRTADDRIEIIWMTDESPTRRAQIALFNEVNREYRVVLDSQGGAGTLEKSIVQSLGGVGPDLVDCYIPAALAAYVRSGVARDCTEDLAARGIDLDAYWPSLDPFYIYEGRAYGLPGNAHAPAIWYNKRLFDEAGEPYPKGDWTWDEFIEVAKRLTKRDANGRIVQYGLIEVWEVGDCYNFPTFLYQWGGRIYTPEGTRCLLDSPEAIAAAQFLHDLAFLHEVMPGPYEAHNMASAGGWGQGPLAMFGAEMGAMALGGRWWLNLYRTAPYRHLRLGAVESPRGPQKAGVVGYGRSTLVNAKTRHLEGALQFLDFLHGPHWNNIVNRQADAMGAVRKYSYSSDFLHNPDYPHEDYHEVWRAAMESSVPGELSIYVNGQTVERILIKQTDLLKTNAKSAEAAMRDAAREVNKAIIDTIRQDPVLKAKYMKAVAAGAQSAWDRPEDAP